MQSFNICCYSEHPHPPIFMSHCRLADINQPFSLFSRLKSINIGCKPWHLWTIGIKWQLAKQWERWPIHLHVSLAQTLKYNRFWKKYDNVIIVYSVMELTSRKPNYRPRRGSPLSCRSHNWQARIYIFFFLCLNRFCTHSHLFPNSDLVTTL